MGQTISLSTRHGRISGWKATPHSSPRGAVIVVQEIFGVNSHIRNVADRFAGLGYTTIAPSLFDLVKPGVVLGYDEAGVEEGRKMADELGFEGALDGVRAAYDALRDEHRVAAVGFCWGGTVAFLANTRFGLPAVSYYGGRTMPFLHERPKAPLMMHFGEYDPLIPPEDVEAHRKALPANVEIHVWQAGHGFNCDQRPDYDAEAAQLAMERTQSFLRKHVQHST